MSMYGLSASLNFPAQVSSLWRWMGHLMLALPGQAVKLLMLTMPPCLAMPCVQAARLLLLTQPPLPLLTPKQMSIADLEYDFAG